MVDSNLGFGLLKNPASVQSSDYKSAGSHQSENLSYKLLQEANTWTEIRTVPAAKTFYASAIVISSATSNVSQIGTGAAAAETAIFAISITNTTPLVFTIPTPIKFQPGTRISVRANTANDVHFALLGWEE